MELTIEDSSAVRDEGTVIVLEGVNEEGVFWFAADRRPALAIIEALQSGAEESITVQVEAWQIVGAAL